MRILEHVGRKSGKPYRTPLNVFSTDDGRAHPAHLRARPGLAEERDDRGQGACARYGKTFTVTEPRVMPKGGAAP